MEGRFSSLNHQSIKALKQKLKSNQKVTLMFSCFSQHEVGTPIFTSGNDFFMTQQQFDWLFNKAKELMEKTKDPVHDWSHIEQVLNNALKIKRLLPADKQVGLEDKILILAAAWHDISYCFYKVSAVQYFLEARRTVTIAKKYFQAAGLVNKEIDLINNIIWHHPLSLLGFLNKKRSCYHQIIQDADFFDNFNQERIKKAEETAPQYFFRTIVIKVMKPLFFQFLIKNKKWFLNLSDIVKALNQ